MSHRGSMWVRGACSGRGMGLLATGSVLTNQQRGASRTKRRKPPPAREAAQEGRGVPAVCGEAVGKM